MNCPLREHFTVYNKTTYLVRLAKGVSKRLFLIWVVAAGRMRWAGRFRESVHILKLHIRVPVAEAPVLGGLLFGQDKVGEAEHGGHVFFIAEVVAGDA